MLKNKWAQDLDVCSAPGGLTVSAAVAANDISALLTRIKEHPEEVNQRDDRDWTPIHVAASVGAVQAIRFKVMTFVVLLLSQSWLFLINCASV